MGNFLDNILHNGTAGNLVEAAKEKIEDGSVTTILDKLGIGGGKIGELASGVLNVIGLAGNAFGKKEDEESENAEEEQTEETEK